MNRAEVCPACRPGRYVCLRCRGRDESWTPGDFGRLALNTDPATVARQLREWATNYSERHELAQWFETVYYALSRDWPEE